MDKSIKENWSYEAEYNGKEEGCGDLIMTLFKFFKTIPPGTRVCVSAYDKGAVIDIPAWCRSTNKELIEANPPYYLILKK
jgi:tRNA 2-thiouridine synthesizing protein A